MTQQRMRRCAGLTLLELMITLALFAFLMLVGLPLTRAWVQSVHQRDAAGMVIEGLGRAKALALRNPQALTDQTLPAAVACLVSGQIRVAAAASSGATCSQSITWTTTLPSDATVVKSADNTAFQCVAYNERGIALVTSVGSLACTQSSLNVNVGSLDVFPVSLP